MYGAIGNGPQWIVIEDDALQLEPLVIHDVGPWDRHRTITNEPEFVVNALVTGGRLNEGRRLFYIDSDGEKSELLIKDGKFSGFA